MKKLLLIIYMALATIVVSAKGNEWVEFHSPADALMGIPSYNTYMYYDGAMDAEKHLLIREENREFGVLLYSGKDIFTRNTVTVTIGFYEGDYLFHKLDVDMVYESGMLHVIHGADTYAIATYILNKKGYVRFVAPTLTGYLDMKVPCLNNPSYKRSRKRK